MKNPAGLYPERSGSGRPRMTARVAAASVLSCALFGCGQSSADGGGSGGAASSLKCDSSEVGLTAAPGFSVTSLTAGQSTPMSVTVPVTQATDRVIVAIAEFKGSGTAIGITDQAYNPGHSCQVTIPLVIFDWVAPGEYFAEINLSPHPLDGGGAGSFVSYDLLSPISTTNYTLTKLPATVVDSGIAISSFTVQ